MIAQARPTTDVSDEIRFNEAASEVAATIMRTPRELLKPSWVSQIMQLDTHDEPSEGSDEAAERLQASFVEAVYDRLGRYHANTKHVEWFLKHFGNRF